MNREYSFYMMVSSLFIYGFVLAFFIGVPIQQILFGYIKIGQLIMSSLLCIILLPIALYGIHLANQNFHVMRSQYIVFCFLLPFGIGLIASVVWRVMGGA